jgi:hypothetical protein
VVEQLHDQFVSSIGKGTALSPNEKEISHGALLKTIRRECVSAKTRIALGKPGTETQSRV